MSNDSISIDAPALGGFDPAASQFSVYLDASGCSPNTARAYAQDRSHLRSFLVEQGLEWPSLTPALAVDLLLHLRNKRSHRRGAAQYPSLATVNGERGARLSTATINRVLAAVSSFYEWGRITERFDGPNPITRVHDRAAARVSERHRPFLTGVVPPRPITTDCLDNYSDGTARLRIPVGKTARERMIPLHDEAADALRAVLAIRAEVADRHLPDERTGDLVRFVFVWRGKLMSDRHLFGTPLRRACEAASLIDAVGKPTITMHRFRHTLGTELAERGAKLHTIMSILGHESPQMTMVYARISDAEVLRDYRSVLEPGAMIAGAGAEAIRAGALSDSAIDWLRTNFLKTELELGHCLRLPSEGPCECDLYLSCSRFVTTPTYAPRPRERHRLELSLADDARERSWPREVERHCSVAHRIEQLLTDLGQGVD
ncbi:MAG: tyrosine-type recombinase/integrase [Rhodospirillales bacterium]|nr:tyrosine-type recombinase/integrase [Rhodospirillales bacterium]